MRKMLQSKKGFTLVELMIVVVIMGILVAVAIPVYSAVTKNSKNKSCASNINVLKTQANSYLMTGGANGAEIAGTGTSDISDDSGFLALLDGGTLPTCPFSKAQDYVVNATFTDGGFTIAVTHDDTAYGGAQGATA